MFYFLDISSNNLCYRSVTWLAYVILADGYLVTSLLNYFTGVWKTRDNSANAAMKFKILTFIADAFVEFLNQSVAAGWWWNTKNYHFDCWFLNWHGKIHSVESIQVCCNLIYCFSIIKALSHRVQFESVCSIPFEFLYFFLRGWKLLDLKSMKNS